MIEIQPSGFIKEEKLVDREIVEPRESVLGRIRGTLRTDWLTAGERGYYYLEDIMEDLHKELSKPKWWRDVAIPANVDFQEGRKADTTKRDRRYVLMKYARRWLDEGGEPP